MYLRQSIFFLLKNIVVFQLLFQVKSFQTRMWLIALRNICCASLSEFTVFSLEKSIENLNSARLSLSVRLH